MYNGWVDKFNPIQTQVNMNDNVFVEASGKIICAKFAHLRLWSKPNNGHWVYIAPFQEVVDFQVAQWRQKFGKIQGGKNIVLLTGETSADLCLLESGDATNAT